jgi:hypothetical protein
MSAAGLLSIVTLVLSLPTPATAGSDPEATPDGVFTMNWDESLPYCVAQSWTCSDPDSYCDVVSDGDCLSAWESLFGDTTLCVETDEGFTCPASCPDAGVPLGADCADKKYVVVEYELTIINRTGAELRFAVIKPDPKLALELLRDERAPRPSEIQGDVIVIPKDGSKTVTKKLLWSKELPSNLVFPGVPENGIRGKGYANPKCKYDEKKASVEIINLE